MSFAELHCHTDNGSNLRFRDSTVKVPAAIDYAIKLGHKALAITDHESLSAHIKALCHMRDLKSKAEEKGEALDFSLILGNEIYLIDEADQQNTDKFYHFILLAKDAIGHKQLRLLSTRAWGRCYHYKNRDAPNTFYRDIEEIVGTNPGHLVASSACLGGQLPHLTLAGDTNGVHSFVTWCQQVFGRENFFVEMQCGVTPEQKEFNQRILRYCKHFDVPWIITNDVHYLAADKRILHENFLKSEENDSREMGEFYESTYFKSEDEMRERLGYLDEADVTAAFENTIKIADMCKDAGDYGLFHSTIVPQRKLPEFQVKGTLDVDGEKYPYIHRYYTSSEPQDLWLMKQLEDGMALKKMPLDDLHLERINYELEQLWGVSERLGQPMSAYYNLTQLIVQIMWNKNGEFTPPACTDDESVVGVSRGSVGGWFLAYLMQITQLDPIKWEMPAWRHLHASRPDMPDCDLDSSAIRKNAILQRTKYVFGEDHCLNTITLRTETTKAAIKTACRGLGIDADIANELSGLVPATRGHVWTIKECMEGTEDNGYTPVTELVNKLKAYPNLLETICEIEGLISGRGIHASSVFIYNAPYIEHNSLMRAPKGTECTCWDMGGSDLCSGLKEDYLTIEGCDKLQKCIELLVKDDLLEWKGSLKDTYDSCIHPDVLDYDSPEMWRMMADGEICDLFQMVTDCGGDAIRKVRPTNLKELSLTNSVMRLMGNEDMVPIDRFAAFKNDVVLWYQEMKQNGLNTDEIATLEAILLPNYGCSIEQEDMMILCMDERIAGFTMTEANKIRKAVAKKKPAMVTESKALFFKKGKEIGTRDEMLNYVWKYCIKPQLG